MVPAGRLIGIILFIGGIALTTIGYYQLNETGAIMKLLVAMPALALWGFSLILFPGAKDITPQLLKSGKANSSEIFSKAPTLHWFMWIIFILLGILLAVWKLLG